MTTTLLPINLHNAIEHVERARRALVALYLATPPEDTGYEVAVAETVVPEHLRDLGDSLHSAYEALLNIRDLDLES